MILTNAPQTHIGKKKISLINIAGKTGDLHEQD
jgi:hypothetical protein